MSKRPPRAARAASAKGFKVCVECDTEKPLTDFPAARERGDGRHPYCKPCKAKFQREANARWAIRNPIAHKRHQKNASLKRMKIGVDLARYEQLLAAQGGVCLICGDEPNPLALAVDHCHTAGTVRGLLCRQCNLGLGLFRDRPDLLAAAAAYLTQHQQGTTP